MGDVKVSLRLDSELIDLIKTRDGNISEAIRATLNAEYNGVVEQQTQKATKEVKSTVSKEAHFFPVGDVICADTDPQSQLWWCPKNRMNELSKRCKEWTENGFLLKFGQKGRGTWESPEVIEDVEQERKQGGRYSPSCRGNNALLGDCLVWLEISDSDKALDFMQKHSDIPCAVRCDVHKYMSDETYREVFEHSNKLFIHYCVHGYPLRLKSEPLSKSEWAKMYDL